MKKDNVAVGENYLLRIDSFQIVVKLVEMEPRKLKLRGITGDIYYRASAGSLSKHYDGCMLVNCQCAHALAHYKEI